MAVVSARASPHSLPSSSPLPPLSPQSLPPSPQPPLPPLSPRSLPPSLQPDVERMFVRGGSGRSSNGTSRSTSLREIDEEAAVADDGGGKLYVAVGKDLKDGKSNLLWAARNMPQGVRKLVLLHVHQPAERIMSGLSKVHASQLEEKKLKAHREMEEEEMNTLVNQYLNYCKVFLKVQAEILVIEKNNAANGIIELIDRHCITNLVMGTSSFSTEANQDSTKADSPRSSSASSLSDQPQFPARSVSLPPGHPGYLSSPDQVVLPRRSNSVSYPSSGLIANNVEKMSPVEVHSIDLAPKNCSPNSSHRSTRESSSPSSPKDLFSTDGSPAPVSIVSSEEHQHSMVETGIQNEVFEQLQQVRNDLERSRKEASEGRQKAERELFEASMKFKARENSLCKEKREVEERLTREKANLEKEHLQTYNELQKANEQRAELENKLLQTNSLLEELQQLQAELVTLIGVCREAKVLVYEFLPNGSLEDRLQCKHHTEPLPWTKRVGIAAEICTALIFLHSNKPKGIAHGDLKPDNVLLDANFVCKLGDFGISRSLNLTNTTVTPYHRTSQIKGTLGYMDPGYIASGELTAQYDVYSFGVVLLRLLTGKSPLGLQNEVEAALSNGVLHEIFDASAGEWPPEYAEELAGLALRCCHYDRKERPDLAKEAWGVLQAMLNEPSSSSMLCPGNKSETPSYFICPMAQEIMRDPHIAADGFTYEGDAIKEWLQRGHKMSPMTYLSFTHHELIPNNALRFAIQEWQQKQQQCFNLL